MKSIKKAEIKQGTRVFVRADLDVPLEQGVIKDTFRLEMGLPTLRYIIEKGGIPIIAGHIGRPGGKVNTLLSTDRLKRFYDNNLDGGKYVLLENLRFDPREVENSEEFARELAKKADIYVNECFATSHREHVSFLGIPKLLPSYAGLRLQEEISTLKRVITNPKRPFIAIVGGAKVETKKAALFKFLEIADYVLVGGRIGLDWEEDIPSNLHLPLDYAGGAKDIGYKTVQDYCKILESAGTIVWSGPMGVYEEEDFLHGTKKILESIEKSSAFSIAGGGDTLAAIDKLSDKSILNFISTGGGAMLEFLVKGNLPGLKALGYRG